MLKLIWILQEIPVDPLAFDNWVQVVALVVIVLGGIAFKWIGDKAKATNQTVNEIKETLTENNSGGNVKDMLEKIQSDVESVGKKTGTLENRMDEHLEWSRNWTEEHTNYSKVIEKQVDGLWEVVSPNSPDEDEPGRGDTTPSLPGY